MKIEKRIEREIEKKFPGAKVEMIIDLDGEWHLNTLPGSKERFDELYPNMTSEQADEQILTDLKNIILKYLPDTQFIDYERYGELHKFAES